MISNWKSWLIFIGGVGVGLFLLMFFASASWIGYSVADRCAQAEGKYGQDCVMSLTAQLSDEAMSMEKRNEAIWALGQMGDKRALPVLKSYYTSRTNHCDRQNELCQYELGKAIRLIESGFNLTHFVWQRN